MTVNVKAHRYTAHCSAGNENEIQRNTKDKPKTYSKAYFQMCFYANQICKLNHAIIQLTDKHTVAPSQAPTNIQTPSHTRRLSDTKFKLAISEC